MLIRCRVLVMSPNPRITGAAPAMVDLTPFLPGLSPVQGKAVVARFDGGGLSSEGGLLALREIERRRGLADRLANCLADPRALERVVHRLAEIIRFRMLMIAAGYDMQPYKRAGPNVYGEFRRLRGKWGPHCAALPSY